MVYKFTKMHGAGNDYVYINCFEEKVNDPCAVSILLSDRHKGIGGDGLVLICPSETADAKMRMFNLDGSEGMMCGNAIRCVSKFLYDNNIAHKNVITIETKSGIKTIEIKSENDRFISARVNMGKAILEPEKIPMKYEGESFINKPVSVNGKEYLATAVSMGNPHCVIFMDDVKKLDIEKIGPAFENHPLFPDRVNTEFIRIIDRNNIEMRVWERGSGETLACGTGSCAAVAACVLNGFSDYDEPVNVHLRGGILTDTYKKDGTVFMEGSATKVFEGIIDTDDMEE